MKLVKEALHESLQDDSKSNPNAFNENTIADIMSAAASGYRIKVNGKVI